MATPTILRAKQIGKYLGVAIGCDEARGHSAHFQLAMDVGDGKLLMIRDDRFEADAGAIKLFNDWMHEAYLLVEAGDM